MAQNIEINYTVSLPLNSKTQLHNHTARKKTKRNNYLMMWQQTEIICSHKFKRSITSYIFPSLKHPNQNYNPTQLLNYTILLFNIQQVSIHTICSERNEYNKSVLPDIFLIFFHALIASNYLCTNKCLNYIISCQTFFFFINIKLHFCKDFLNKPLSIYSRKRTIRIIFQNCIYSHRYLKKC